MLVEFSVLGTISWRRKGENAAYVLRPRERRLVRHVTCFSLLRFEGKLDFISKYELEHWRSEFCLARDDLGPPSFCLGP